MERGKGGRRAEARRLTRLLADNDALFQGEDEIVASVAQRDETAEGLGEEHLSQTRAFYARGAHAIGPGTESHLLVEALAVQDVEAGGAQNGFPLDQSEAAPVAWIGELLER